MKKNLIVSAFFGIIIGAGIFTFAMTSAKEEIAPQITTECHCNGDISKCTCEGECQCADCMKKEGCNKEECNAKKDCKGNCASGNCTADVVKKECGCDK